MLHRERVIKIGDLRVPRSYRGKGYGRNAIRCITRLADRLRYSTNLLASPLDKLTSVEGLETFYCSEGFRRTGRLSVLGHPYMARNPRKPRTQKKS